MAFSNEEIEEFKAEAFELLDTAENNLLNLDNGADFRPTFDAIFRSFHNLKGAAGMMELLKLQSHTHELESMFMQFKEGTQIPKNYLSLFLRGVDAARSLLNNEDPQFDFAVGGANASPEPAAPVAVPVAAPVAVSFPVVTDLPDSAVLEFLLESEEIVDRVSDVLQLLEANTHKKEDIEALCRDVHSLKGSAYLFCFHVLGNIAHAMESSLEGVRSNNQTAFQDLINVLFKCIKSTEGAIIYRRKEHLSKAA